MIIAIIFLKSFPFFWVQQYFSCFFIEGKDESFVIFDVCSFVNGIIALSDFND